MPVRACSSSASASVAIWLTSGPAALSLAVGLPGAYGQLSVEACREKARANYPLARQAALIEEGRGLGRRIMEAVLAEASAAGARRSYLQVVEGNRPAEELYRSLGYSVAYPYWYRARRALP